MPILSKTQYGFQKNHSTELALLNLKENILDCFNKSLKSLAIIIDFTKAFDCIDHNILKKKLKWYGVNSAVLAFFSSYLSERNQFVKLNEYSSGFLQTKSGIPQGSILGPLFFNIYVNDLVKCIDSEGVSLLQFADDTTIFCWSKTNEALKHLANTSLNKL